MRIKEDKTNERRQKRPLTVLYNFSSCRSISSLQDVDRGAGRILLFLSSDDALLTAESFIPIYLTRFLINVSYDSPLSEQYNTELW